MISFSCNLLTTDRKSLLKSQIHPQRVFYESSLNKTNSKWNNVAVLLGHLRTDLVESPRRAHPEGVRTLPTRGPKTERRPDHRHRSAKQAFDRSKTVFGWQGFRNTPSWNSDRPKRWLCPLLNYPPEHRCPSHLPEGGRVRCGFPGDHQHQDYRERPPTTPGGAQCPGGGRRTGGGEIGSPRQGSAERHQPPPRPPGSGYSHPHPGQSGEYEGDGKVRPSANWGLLRKPTRLQRNLSQRTSGVKLETNRSIVGCCNC